MRVVFAVVAPWAIISPLSAAVIGPAMAPYEDLPDDRRCEHVQMVTENKRVYTIHFRGTVDGAMTRDVVGYAAFGQGWQPNRSVLIENVGKSNVHNPRIVVNGKRNWWSLDDILAEAAAGYTAPADRARAIWEFHRRQRFHATTWDAECSDAVKVLNVYGYTLCGNEAHIVNDYWKAAGLRTRRGYPIGHCVTEPVAYKVYGSDEKGFTASDTEYPVFQGKGFVETMEDFAAKASDAPDAGTVTRPSNLIARVEGSSLRVVGLDVALPNANSAFYRVAAVDAAGVESGPSDYAEVPRPMVVLPAEDQARLGSPYRMEPKQILSIGDLRCRRSPESSYNAAFWDRQRYAFRAKAVPEGLTVDPATGTIWGTPTAGGEYEVRFMVSDQTGGDCEFGYRLVVRE